MYKIVIALGAFLTLAAGTGCEPKGVPPGVTLPKPPEHYAACFKKLTPIPLESLDRVKVVKLVAELRRSELAKSRCGKDLLEWYNTVRVAYSRRKR